MDAFNFFDNGWTNFTFISSCFILTLEERKNVMEK